MSNRSLYTALKGRVANRGLKQSTQRTVWVGVMKREHPISRGINIVSIGEQEIK